MYPDVRPTLAALREMGLWVGIAGNQTAKAGRIFRELRLPADFIATSSEWGVAKPDPAFFARVVDAAPGNPGEIVYVGDHRDNDLVPAKAAGLRTAHIRRGPWGHLWADRPHVAAARRLAHQVPGRIALPAGPRTPARARLATPAR